MYYYTAEYEPDLSYVTNEATERNGWIVIRTYKLENGVYSEHRNFYTQQEWEDYSRDKEMEPTYTGADIISVTFNPRYTKLPGVKKLIPLRWSNKKYMHGWLPK